MNRKFDQFLQHFNPNVLYSIHRYKYVEVTMCDYEIVEGWLKCIDPPTANAILVTFDDGSFEMKHVILVLGRNIRRMRVLKESNPNVKSALEKLYAPPEEAEVDANRRDRLIAFLKAHTCLIEVIEDGLSLLVNNSVKIRPPYIFESCMTSNRRVLMCIKYLLLGFDSQNALVKAELFVKNEAVSSPDLSASKKDGNMPCELSSTSAEAASYEISTFNENPISSNQENLKPTMLNNPGDDSFNEGANMKSAIQKASEETFCKKAISSKDANLKSSMQHVAVEDFTRKEAFYGEDANLKSAIQNVTGDDSSCKDDLSCTDAQLKSAMQHVAAEDSSRKEALYGKDANLKSAIQNAADEDSSSNEDFLCKDAQLKSAMQHIAAGDSSRKEALYGKDANLKSAIQNVADEDSSSNEDLLCKDAQLKSAMQHVAAGDSSRKEALSGKNVNLKSAIQNLSDEYPSSEGACNKSTTKMLPYKDTFDIVKRKNELMSWIKSNECPVREVEGSRALLVCECVTIYPPYKVQCCISTCKIILGPICDLVHRFEHLPIVQVDERMSAYSTSTEEYDFDKFALSLLNGSPTSSDKESSSSDESICCELPYLRKLVSDAKCPLNDAVTSSEESTSTEESFEFIVNHSNE